MSIGDRLLELRKEKNMSQEEVADIIGVSRQTISKWETNQSTPDFDKIVPLCNLYEITTDELLKGEKKIIDSNSNVLEIKRKTALVVSMSVFLYFISIIWIIISQEIRMSDYLSVSIFLLICGISTVLLIYHFMSRPKLKKEIVESKKDKKIKGILNIISTITLIIYLLTSFLTMAWHLTWIIWIIYALIEEIVKLIFNLGGNKDAE